MNKAKVAVCDLDDEYRNRFAAYLVRHKSAEYTVHGFSEPEILREALEQEKFDLVLLGPGFYEFEELLQDSQQAYLILSETEPCGSSDAGRDFTQESEGMHCIFRYQSMETILHEMQVQLADVSGEGRGAEAAYMTGMEVIGMVSPVKHEMQMPFSFIFAALLAEKRKILYINLMEYSGFPDLFKLTDGYDMGDIVLRIRNRRLKADTFLRCVYETDGLSYIPPFKNPQDLLELSSEDFKAFLTFLETQTDFEGVVIDFGTGLKELSGMLMNCTSIYCLIKSGFYFNCQIDQFLEYLHKSTSGSMEGRLQFLTLPFSAKGMMDGEDLKKQLLWSEFGDYVRNCLTGASYEVV